MISSLALSLVAFCAPQGSPSQGSPSQASPSQAVEPQQLGLPPTLEEARGSGASASFGPANVGKNLKLNGDRTTRLQNEYSLAINPKNPQNFIASANDYRTGKVKLGHYASLDGGKTIISDGVLPLARGWTDAGDPGCVFDGFGNGYIMGLHFNRRPVAGGLYVHKTTDGGRTFAAPVLAFKASRNLPDKPLITADQRTSGRYAGSLYITFTGFYAAPVGLNCVASHDGGKTWSSPVRMGSGQGTSPAVGPKGELYVSWASRGRIFFNSSINGGASFRGVRSVASISTNPRTLPPTRFRCNSFPTTAVDTSDGPFRGRIHVSWSSRSGASSEIFACYSDNGGTSWSTPKRVNDVAKGDQFFQWMAVDEAGAVFCCWQDRRNDPANRSYESYASASFDGGQTWIRNWKASETSNNPGTTGFIGDYNGLDAQRGRAFATWVDFRNGNQDAYSAAVQADLEFAPQTLSASTGGSVSLPIKAGPARKGQFYLMLASGGTNAGVQLGKALFFLDFDPLLTLSLSIPNVPPFVGFFGKLGAGGISTLPKFSAPAGLLTPLAGKSISFAFVLLDKSLLTYGSNPVTVRVSN